MSARLLDGRDLANKLREDLSQRVQRLASRPTGPPRLAILGDGVSEAASLYAASLDRAAGRVGIGTELRLGANASMEAAIEQLNLDPAIAGIVIAQPFADPVEGRRLVQHVDPAKDVDGATPTNAGWLARGEPAFVPATALAVIELLEAYDVPIAGRRTVIVGRSAVVGRPVASLLLARDSTIVVCHRATRDLARETRAAELLVVAAGVAGLVGADMVSPGATVVDCGINAVNGEIVGDVDTAAVGAVVDAISPVPGGVGPVTPMMVLRQTVEAAERASSSSA